MRKEIFGWVFDGAMRVIKLPVQKLDSIIVEVKAIVRLTAIPFKRFEKVVGHLRHVAIELPVGRWLCVLLNRVIALHNKVVALNKNSAIR